ncbi:MAG TPA: serine/threonine-protein kinase, partial [Kofleriaceae bacterium]
RDVALKFVSGEVSDAVRERFYLEARAVARLAHPNVVSVYRVGELQRRPYLVSEYIAGTSLDRLAKPLSYERVREIGLGLARGLAAAHEREVLHRDIKPANAIVSAAGDAKLLDFGLAKLLDVPGPMLASSPVTADRDVDATISIVDRLPSLAPGIATTPGEIVGTPLYLAPELWLGANASQRSDLYSLGAVLFELVTGRAPHAGTPIDQLSARVTTITAPALTGVPAWFAELVASCLAIDPSERPVSAQTVADRVAADLAPAITSSPYRGLLSFEAEQRGVFFGRSREILTVVERLRRERFVVVAGDSGIGKSSLCRAGVLPKLRDDAPDLEIITCVPGTHPVLPVPTGPAVIFVDQLEELLTLADRDRAEAFARDIITAVATRADLQVLVTVRVDFLGRLASLDAFADVLSHRVELVGPLSDRGMREAITGPAEAVGYEVEPAIVDELVRWGRESLPLLQFTLAELWELRDDEARRLTRSALATRGGVGGALARHADRVMASLDGKRELAWRVIGRLITSDGTRAVIHRDELDQLAGETDLVERLVQARLVVFRDDLVEVAHEALFTHWPAFAAWRAEHDHDARFRDQLGEAARRWHERGRPRGLLWRGEALAEYRAWARRWAEPQTTQQLAFGAAAVAEAQRARRARTIAIGAVIGVLSIAALVLYRSDRTATHARDAAETQRLALVTRQAQAELEAGRAQRAFPYFVEALRSHADTPAIRFGIAEALRTIERDRGLLVSAPEGVYGLARSHDGAWLVITDRVGTIYVLDRERHLRTLRHGTTQLYSPKFCPDDRTVVAQGVNGAVVVNVERGDVRLFTAPDHVSPALEGSVACSATAIASTGKDGRVIVWDRSSGKLTHTLEIDSHSNSDCVAFSADGAQLFAGNSRGQFVGYDFATGAEILRSELPGPESGCQISIGPRGDLAVGHAHLIRHWATLDAAPITATATTGLLTTL